MDEASGQAIDLSTSVTVSSGVVYRDLDGEAVLLDLDSGLYFGLDEVGTRIWLLLVEGASLQDIKRRLLAEYEVDGATLERDIMALIGKLAENSLVGVSARSSP